MPTLGQIISRMRDAGESQENIDATRAEYERLNAPKPTPSLFKNPTAGLELPRGNPQPTSPTDFWSGFGESLRSGEAAKAGGRGALSYAKGALNLPKTIAGLAEGLSAGLDSLATNPYEHFRAAPQAFKEMGQQILDTTTHAGSNPEEFGEMAGEFFGQPLVTEGVLGGIGAARNALRPGASNLISGAGRVLEGTPPGGAGQVSTPGMIGTRTIRKGVSEIGKGMQRTAERMRFKAADIAAQEALNKPGIPLKDPTEGEPMGGGMGITRPRVARPSIPSTPPPPSQVPLGTQPPLAEVESAGDYARRGGSGSNPVPPSAFGPHPIPSEADPMFLSPEAPPAPPTTQTGFEGGGVIDTPNVNINQNIPPAPPPPPTQTSFMGGSVIDTPNVRFRQGSAVEPPPAPTPTPPPKTFEPSVKPETFAPEDVELMKARKAEIREILERLKAKEEGVDPTTGEIIEPPPEPTPAPTSKPRKTRSKGKWNLSKAEAPPAEPKATVEPDAFAQPGPEAPTPPEPTGGVVEPVAQRPSLFGDERGAVKFWGEGLEGGPRRRPTLNRSMFEQSARIGAEESAAARQGSAFSDATPGANEFSPDVVQGSENVFEGTSPTFTPREGGAPPTPKKTFMDSVNEFIRDESGSADPRFADPEFWKQYLAKAEDDFFEGRVNKPTDPYGYKDIWTRNWDRGPFEPEPVVPHSAGFEGTRPPGNNPGQYPAPMHGERWPELINEAEDYNIDTKGKYPDWIELARKVSGEENKLIDMPGEMSPQELEALQLRVDTDRVFGPAESDAPPSFIERQKNLLKSETGSVGKGIKQQTIAEKNAGAAKPTPSNLVSNLVKSGDVVRSQVKNVGPKGQTFKVTGPDGKSLGTINVTNERVAEVLKAYGGDGNPDEIAKLIYETDLDDILDQAKVRYKKENMDSSELKVDTVDNRTTKAPTKAKAEAPKEKMPYPFGPKEEAAPVDTEATGAPTEGAGGYGPKGVSDKLSDAISVTPGTAKSTPDKIDLTDIYEKGSSIRPISNEAGRLDSIKAPDAKYRGLLPKNMRYELKVGETYRERLKWVVDNLMAGENMTPEAEAIRMKEMDAFNESVKKSIGMDKPSDIPPLDPKKVDLTKLRPGKINQQPPTWISPRTQQGYPELARRLRESDAERARRVEANKKKK